MFVPFVFLLEWGERMGRAVVLGEFSLFPPCSETSEVLQYTAAEAEDVEKVRVCCIY